MKAWIQSTSLYLQINGWPPNQLQPDRPTLHSLKPSQRHCSKLHAEYYISLMILPWSPDSCQFVSVFFSSVALSRSLSLLFFPFFCCHCLKLCISVRRRPALGMKAKNIKRQYFWRCRRWILASCNVTIGPSATALKRTKPGILSLQEMVFQTDIKMTQTSLSKGICWPAKANTVWRKHTEWLRITR